MHKISWLTLLGQVVNVTLHIAAGTSPHVAMIAGGILGITQAILPSVSKTVNVTALPNHITVTDERDNPYALVP